MPKTKLLLGADWNLRQKFTSYFGKVFEVKSVSHISDVHRICISWNPKILLIQHNLGDLPIEWTLKRIEGKCDTMPIVLVPNEKEMKEYHPNLKKILISSVTIRKIKLFIEEHPILKSIKSEKLVFHRLVFNRKTDQVYIYSMPLKLPTKEKRLLELLMANVGKVLTRDQLLEEIEPPQNRRDEILVIHIAGLRKKLNDFGYRHYLKTIRFKGYMLSDEDSSSY